MPSFPADGNLFLAAFALLVGVPTLAMGTIAFGNEGAEEEELTWLRGRPALIAGGLFTAAGVTAIFSSSWGLGLLLFSFLATWVLASRS